MDFVMLITGIRSPIINNCQSRYDLFRICYKSALIGHNIQYLNISPFAPLESMCCAESWPSWCWLMTAAWFVTVSLLSSRRHLGPGQSRVSTGWCGAHGKQRRWDCVSENRKSMERIDTSHNYFSTNFTLHNIKFCEHPPSLNILPIKVDQSPRNLISTKKCKFVKIFSVFMSSAKHNCSGVIKISFAHTYLCVNYAKIINILKPVILRKTSSCCRYICL